MYNPKEWAVLTNIPHAHDIHVGTPYYGACVFHEFSTHKAFRNPEHSDGDETHAIAITCGALAAIIGEASRSLENVPADIAREPMDLFTNLAGKVQPLAV